MEKEMTPSNSSYDPSETYHSAYLNYGEAKKRLINAIDDQYLAHPNSHIVVYAEKRTNDKGDYWEIYMLR